MSRSCLKRPYDEKDIAACSLSGFINRDGTRVDGNDIIRSIALLHERGNGLGGGFAAYGIYPEHADCYAFHLFYESTAAKDAVELYLAERFHIKVSEEIPTRKHPRIGKKPIIWRYFLIPREEALHLAEMEAEDFVVDVVMTVNSDFDGAYVFSSGVNMGAFKGVGYPEDIGEFYRLDEYRGHLWTAHGRFPTNTPGWWGGAHPFTLLNWSIVHNGEISSYGINRRYLEMYGYKCSLQTDTEVTAYLFDLLLRRHGLPLEAAVIAVASPLWKEIDRLPEDLRAIVTAVRMVYGSALLNGPFAFLLANGTTLVGISDRVKLRPLVAATKGSTVYMASEESGIREICPHPERVWYPKAGCAVVAKLTGVEDVEKAYRQTGISGYPGPQPVYPVPGL